MQDYKKLLVYQEAYSLTKEIYGLTKKWPPEELYSLCSQIRRSSHSVNSNICEGVSRETIADSLRFLQVAYASLKETENHLTLAYDLSYVGNEEYQNLSAKIDTICRMLRNFIQFKKNKSQPLST